jgi:TatD DNase family protein
MQQSAGFFDAHCHLQDRRLVHCLDTVLRDAEAADVRYAVVNGTHEGDWPAVLSLCTPRRVGGTSEHHLAPSPCCCLPSLGLHPWFLDTATATWQERLEAALVAHPRAAVGEVGLHLTASSLQDAEAQASALASQLQLAAKLRRPVSVHCVGPGSAQRLCSELQTAAPAGGFAGLLVHGFSGEAHFATRMQAMGAHFSFSAANTRQKTLALLQAIADDRLLLETDSPDGILPAGNIDRLTFAPTAPGGGSAIRLGRPGCMCSDDSCDLQPPGRPRPLNTPVRAHAPSTLERC